MIPSAVRRLLSMRRSTVPRLPRSELANYDDVIPAIDLKNGRVCGLMQGRKSDVTVYNDESGCGGERVCSQQARR